MQILFNLLTTIEIPDADEFPPREDVEKQLIDLFMSEGMLTYGLEITNYCVPADDAERRADETN